MYTSYSIEKIASSNRHEALAAAEAAPYRPRVPQHRRPNRGRQSPASGTIRIPRRAAGSASPSRAGERRSRRRSEPVAPGPSACHDPVVAPARLIGRDEDVAILRDAVVSARAGEPRCVLVTGEAGIGKTRLVAEALTGIDDALVVTGHGADMATGEIPFGVLADTLRDLVHLAGRTPSPLLSARPWRRCCPGRCPSGHVERVQVLSAFLDLLQRLCSDRLLVWVVEDLHWADAATRDLVNLAVRTLRGRPARGGDRADGRPRTHSRPGGRPHVVRRRAGAVARHDRAATGSAHPGRGAEQLLGLVGATLPPGVAARIEQLSDGVPFVVEELAAARGRPEVATASGVAAGRLAGLSPESRRLVEAAAVGEGHLRIGLLEQVVDSTPTSWTQPSSRRCARRADHRPRGRRRRVPPRAAPRGRRARARARCPAVVAPAVGRGPRGQPGRAGRRPGRARDRRALAPGPRRTPGARRHRCRDAGGRADLPARRGDGPVDPRAPCLRRASRTPARSPGSPCARPTARRCSPSAARHP